MTYATIDEMWVSMIRSLLSRPLVPTRNGPARELIGTSHTLRYASLNFLANSRRALSPGYASAELLWYLSGDAKIDRVVAYAPQYKKFAETDGSA